MNNETIFPTPWLPSKLFGSNSTQLSNQTKTLGLTYVFTPAGNITKRVLCVVSIFLGIMGFLGNCCIFYFLGKKPKRGVIQTNRFVTNLNLYIRSLSLSDLLNSAVSAPLLCIQISFDVFQRGWACKAVRYTNFVFSAATINTLVVISIEKYLATRTVFRTVSTRSMRRMIIFAWLLGALFMLLPAATYDETTVVLNDTHFTILCKNNEQFFPFRVTWLVLPIQYILPGIFVTYVNLCLMKTVWDSGRRQVATVTKKDFQAELRLKKIRGTTLLVALTFSFIIPFFFFLGNIAYTQIAKPQRDFATDYAWRYGTGCVGYLSAIMNFAIYFVQVRNFRLFFIDLILCRRDDNNHLSDIVVSGEPAVIFKAKSGTHKREEEIIGIKFTNRTE